MEVIPGTRRLRSRLLLTIALAGGAPGLVSAAEFLEFYKNGVAAAASQHWTLAAEMMRKAIEEQPNAKTKIKRALYFRRYLPHFYLGKALYETGDCAAALTAWQESEKQDVVRRFPEYQQILEGRLACGQMVDLEGALDRALKSVESAEKSAIEARRRLSEVPSTVATVPVLLDRQTAAEESLGRARQRLGSDDIAMDEVEEVATVAAIAKAEFEILRQQAVELRTLQLTAQQEEVVVQIQSLMGRASKELKSCEYLQPYPATVARNRASVELALKHAQAAFDDSLSAGELQAVQAELVKVTRDLRRSVSPPPAELRDAAQAYLSRDYNEVLAILSGREFVSARASSHSHLLRAAALFSLYYSTGAGDEALLEQAGEEVLACRRADRERFPPVAVFSPSFVAFFEGQTLEPVESSPDKVLDEGR